MMVQDRTRTRKERIKINRRKRERKTTILRTFYLASTSLKIINLITTIIWGKEPFIDASIFSIELPKSRKNGLLSKMVMGFVLHGIFYIYVIAQKTR